MDRLGILRNSKNPQNFTNLKKSRGHPVHSWFQLQQLCITKLSPTLSKRMLADKNQICSQKKTAAKYFWLFFYKLDHLAKLWKKVWFFVHFCNKFHHVFPIFQCFLNIFRRILSSIRNNVGMSPQTTSYAWKLKPPKASKIAKWGRQLPKNWKVCGSFVPKILWNHSIHA